MPPASIELPPPGPSSSICDSSIMPRFSSLRGLRWRIDLGILPCSPSTSIEDLRRITADSRRRYASLRRHLLIDPHLPKDENKFDLVKDDPLSQSPDSIWGRFFRNAELEKMVDKDLSRLYPEHGSYFQTVVCQVMLRRILLLWCLSHPECGYRQGMHELLAPLLYVLHVDLQHLSQVKGLYEDCFNDEFDEATITEREVVSNYRFKKGRGWELGTNRESNYWRRTAKGGSLDELDPDTRDIFSLSDAYGAEGELGVILSERFMEHDAYCMFNSLMNGFHGAVAMADYFSPSLAIGSSTGLPPVIETSSALYFLLSIVDSSLHNHLTELGVEPQYFALRWLRVLFGREFSLDNLLVIWDDIFSSPNSTCAGDDVEYSFRILLSPRGAFISAIAVSMLLHVRSSLFATENATSCLQRLLNFPKDTNVIKLIEKAKPLQALALCTNVCSSSSQGSPKKNNRTVSRDHSLSSGSASPRTPLYPVPDSYWEEKWRVLHSESEHANGSCSEKKSGNILKELSGKRFGSSTTEYDLSPAKEVGGKMDACSVRHKLLDDSSQELDFDADLGKPQGEGGLDSSFRNDSLSVGFDEAKHFPEELADQSITRNTSYCMTEETCLSGGSSSVSSAATTQSAGDEDIDDLVKGNVTLSSIANDNQETNHVGDPCNNLSEHSPLEVSEGTFSKLEFGTDSAMKREAALKEQKSPSGKFQWFRKFGRGPGEGIMEKSGGQIQRSSIGSNIGKDITGSASNPNSCVDSWKEQVGDKKVPVSLKNIGQSMLENIQEITHCFWNNQEERKSKEKERNKNGKQISKDYRGGTPAAVGKLIGAQVKGKMWGAIY